MTPLPAAFWSLSTTDALQCLGTAAGGLSSEDAERLLDRWDIVAIRKFMMTFGLVSSLFDFLTFAALLFVLLYVFSAELVKRHFYKKVSL